MKRSPSSVTSSSQPSAPSNEISDLPFDELCCALLCINKCSNKYTTGATQVQPQMHP